MWVHERVGELVRETLLVSDGSTVCNQNLAVAECSNLQVPTQHSTTENGSYSEGCFGCMRYAESIEFINSEKRK